jgi:hypothetical protein
MLDNAKMPQAAQCVHPAQESDDGESTESTLRAGAGEGANESFHVHLGGEHTVSLQYLLLHGTYVTRLRRVLY